MSTSLHSDEPTPPAEEPTPPARNHTGTAVVVLLLALLAVAGFLAYRLERWASAVERQVAIAAARSDEAVELSRQAIERVTSAEAAARAAAEGRQLAETETARAREQSEVSRGETEAARAAAAAEREKAARAEAEAKRIKQRAEAETNRLQEALGQIAETRRTALGLVMNLGGDHLKFAFDKAELRSEDRELLSRIAGILITATDYSISVNGHTDNLGTAEYNQALSERRAQAVHDYLAEAGLSRDILSVTGHGKSRPLVPGTSEEARAKNRRVELGIVNTRILYGREAEKATAEAQP